MTRLGLTALALVLAGPLMADECPVFEAPVVTVSHGSRYTDDSKTRSDISEEGEAEIEKALGPVDDYISTLARLSNRALRKLEEDKPDEARLWADCVVEGVYQWAAATALSELGTVNANLSVPSRVGGIAMNYATVLPLASPEAGKMAVINDWMRARAGQITAFFDGPDAPPRASRNNLRAWAALAVARIGLTLGDDGLKRWGEASVREMICTANDDGSLPLEMQRGPLSLHYQIHAVGPLVMTAALLTPGGSTLTSDCDEALARVVGFTLKAIDDPEMAAVHAGKPQKFEPGEGYKPSEMAWLAAWLKLEPEGPGKALATGIENLANTKLGGDQRLLWPGTPETN